MSFRMAMAGTSSQSFLHTPGVLPSCCTGASLPTSSRLISQVLRNSFLGCSLQRNRRNGFRDTVQSRQLKCHAQASGFLEDLRQSLSTFKEEFQADVEWAKGLVNDTKGLAVERLEEAKRLARDTTTAGKAEVQRVVDTVVLPGWEKAREFNRIDRWQDRTAWGPLRIAVGVLYMAALALAVGKGYAVSRQAAAQREAAVIGQAFADIAVPDPTPSNVAEVRRSMWRRAHPDKVKVIKLRLGADGEYHRDPTFVGETAWEEGTGEADKAGLEEGRGMQEGEKPKYTIAEKLLIWQDIFERERLKEELEAPITKYLVQQVGDVGASGALGVEAVPVPVTLESKESGNRAAWLYRRWWKYRPKLAYLDFVTLVANGQVAAAVYTFDLRQVFVTMKEGFPNEFVVDIPVDPYLGDLLVSAGVEVEMLRPSLFPVLRGFLAMAPGIALLLYIFNLNFNMQKAASSRLYDLLHMDRDNLILPGDSRDKIRSQYSEIILGGDVWKVVNELMEFLSNPMKYHDKGVKLPRGILISGPPGTGKTLLARAIARHCGLPFMYASGADFSSESGQGDGVQMMHEFFLTARANAPSIIFIDEVDALAGKNLMEDQVQRLTYRQFLKELDGELEHTDVSRFDIRQAVVLICATNRPEALDYSFVRPGRIDRQVYIGLPDEKARLGIFDIHSRGRKLGPDVEFSKLVYRTVGYSGADIRNFINEAGIIAARKKHRVIMQEDFVDVLERGVFESLGISLTEEEQRKAEQKVPVPTREILAVHEAGHILLSHVLPRFDLHAFTSLMPGGMETALTVFYPREELLKKASAPFGYGFMQMVVLQGGRLAEQLVYGEISDGGSDDLKKISEIARDMASSVGNEKFGLMGLRRSKYLQGGVRREGKEDLLQMNWNNPSYTIAAMGLEMSEMFSREAQRYVDEAHDLALEALQENRHILDELIERLKKDSKISGVEAHDFIMSRNPVLLPNMMPEVDSIDQVRKDVDLGEATRGFYQRADVYPAPFHSA